MAKRMHPCPYRQGELDLRVGVCGACGHPVVDLAAGNETQARRWMARGQAGCVRLLRHRSGGFLFHQKALTGALTVAAALASPLAPRLAAALPGEVPRGEPFELPELSATSDTDPLAFPRIHEPTGSTTAPIEDAHPLTDDQMREQLLMLGYIVYD